LSLIKSISGIRGIIGGKVGKNLTPVDVVECSAGYGWWVKSKHEKPTVVVGRDGRISGEIVSSLSINTLRSLGINIIDLGLSTTPTVEMAVEEFNAQGGIIFTASHNPKQWNALKFLNEKGEFISAQDGKDILQYIAEKVMIYSPVEELGNYTDKQDHFISHVYSILSLPILDIALIRSKKFNVVVDCINSTGALAIPALLDALNCKYTLLNAEVNGEFAHTPEPLPKNLKGLIKKTKNSNADIGIAVDPDVDRLALVCENGKYFGEEYTLVAVADFVLSKTKGNTVSNLSSSRALADVTQKHGGAYHASMVGEVNVVSKMKEVKAVIGGEGNGGVIYPGLHYGRDSLVGIAMILNLMAQQNEKLSTIRSSYPDYTIIKNALPLQSDGELIAIFNKLKKVFSKEKLNDSDGLKIDFKNGWVHMRKSNTEPIIRIYAEAKDEKDAEKLINNVLNQLD